MKGRYFIVGTTGSIIIGLIIISIVNFYYRSNILTGTMIADDVKKLAKIFNTIHKQCRILSFDVQQNPINFLNVEKFSGSEVGSMNLAYPNEWKGPYLPDNPTVQGVEYMVVDTERGYFITPGEGVELPNDKVIGKDIILNKEADITAMMHNRAQLYYNGRPLAARMLELRPSRVQEGLAYAEE